MSSLFFTWDFFSTFTNCLSTFCNWWASAPQKKEIFCLHQVIIKITYYSQYKLIPTVNIIYIPFSSFSRIYWSTQHCIYKPLKSRLCHLYYLIFRKHWPWFSQSASQGTPVPLPWPHSSTVSVFHTSPATSSTYFPQHLDRQRVSHRVCSESFGERTQSSASAHNECWVRWLCSTRCVGLDSRGMTGWTALRGCWNGNQPGCCGDLQNPLRTSDQSCWSCQGHFCGWIPLG